MPWMGTSGESWSRFAMTARSFSLNFGVVARDCRLGGLPAPRPGESGSRSRKLCDERVVLLYTPTLLDRLAAKLPTNEPFLPAPFSFCFCGAMPTGMLYICVRSFQAAAGCHSQCRPRELTVLLRPHANLLVLLWFVGVRGSKRARASARCPGELLRQLSDW